MRQEFEVLEHVAKQAISSAVAQLFVLVFVPPDHVLLAQRTVVEFEVLRNRCVSQQLFTAELE